MLCCIIAVLMWFPITFVLMIPTMALPVSPEGFGLQFVIVQALAVVLSGVLTVFVIYPRLRWRLAVGDAVQCRWCEREFTIDKDGACPVCSEPLAGNPLGVTIRDVARAPFEFLVRLVIWMFGLGFFFRLLASVEPALNFTAWVSSAAVVFAVWGTGKELRKRAARRTGEIEQRRILMHLQCRCGYILRGNVSGVCPECGAAVGVAAEGE
jgi:hypothetical protein